MEPPQWSWFHQRSDVGEGYHCRLWAPSLYHSLLQKVQEALMAMIMKQKGTKFNNHSFAVVVSSLDFGFLLHYVSQLFLWWSVIVSIYSFFPSH